MKKIISNILLFVMLVIILIVLISNKEVGLKDIFVILGIGLASVVFALLHLAEKTEN